MVRRRRAHKRAHKATARDASQAASRRMLRRQIVIGTCLVFVLGLLVYGVWQVTRLPQLTITSVEVTGGRTISHDAVAATVHATLDGSYYRIIPKRFSYLYPHDAIVTAVADIPRVASVSVERQQRTHLAVSFSEYMPHALWCAEDDMSACVFIDAHGYAFATAPPLSGGALVRYRTPGEVPTAGVTAVPPALMREAEAFMATVRQALDVRVHSVWFDDRDITYRLGGGGEFRTARDESLERTLSNLEAIFNSDEFTHLEPGNFQYIDLRYGDKVFVQEELPEVATSTATSTPMEVE